MELEIQARRQVLENRTLTQEGLNSEEVVETLKRQKLGTKYGKVDKYNNKVLSVPIGTSGKKKENQRSFKKQQFKPPSSSLLRSI